MKALLSVCGILTVLTIIPAFAQNKLPSDKPAASMSAKGESIDPAIGKLTVKQMMGKDVYGRDGKDMAKVENVVRSGNKIYIVLDVDHVVDLSDKDVVIPLNKFHMNGNNLTLEMTKDQLNGM